ncbi:hypothetical protein V9T40_011627 [Parthenolecanium corni]|uniref:Uncharacterized protein n=1 Tax=Parthenolecanium corni TaxID=536013 RepID=A0AAN9XYC1_9HEMI
MIQAHWKKSQPTKKHPSSLESSGVHLGDVSIFVQLSHFSARCPTFFQTSQFSSRCLIFRLVVSVSSRCLSFVQMSQFSSRCLNFRLDVLIFF